MNDKRAADRVLATAARAKDAGDYFYLVQEFLLYFFQKSTNKKDYLIERKADSDTEKQKAREEQRRFPALCIISTPRPLKKEEIPRCTQTYSHRASSAAKRLFAVILTVAVF